MKVKLDEGAFAPVRAHSTDAGLDLKADHSEYIAAGESAVFGTSVHVELPSGTCGLIIPRSGLNVNHGLFCTGLIDEGYIGTIKVRLFNFGEGSVVIKEGDRIAQLVVVPCRYETVEIVEELKDTDRGSDGFGSTGR